MKKNKLVTALILCTVMYAPVLASEYTNINIINKTISNLTDKEGNGAALYNSEIDRVVYGSTFTNNSAKLGGAIYNDSTGSITITDSSFEQNTATNDYYGGGAIYNNGGTVTINGDTINFSNNKANGVDTAGGAISSWNSGTLTIDNNAVFEGNSAGIGITAGGAIYSDCNGYTQGTLSIGDNASFTGNTASKAGALYIGGTVATIGDSAKFSNNTATSGAGGAIYTYGAAIVDNGSDISSSLIIGENAVFENNSAGTNGGAIANHYSSTVTIGGGGRVYKQYSSRKRRCNLQLRLL